MFGWDLEFSLEEFGKLLTLWQDRDLASANVEARAREHIVELNQKTSELAGLRVCGFAGLRDTLQDLVEHCHGDDRPDCPTLRDLESGD